MAHVEVERTIDAPVAAVWERLVDVARWPEYFPGLEAVGAVDSGDFAPGFSWAELRDAPGFPRERTWLLVSAEAYSGFEAEAARVDGERTRLSWSLAARGADRTTVALRYERVLEHAPMLVAVASRLTDGLHARAVRRTLAADLDGLAAAID